MMGYITSSNIAGHSMLCPYEENKNGGAVKSSRSLVVRR